VKASLLIIEEGTSERAINATATNETATNKTATAPSKKKTISTKKRELPPKKVFMRLLMQMY
jgi:hypothetical protein